MEKIYSNGIWFNHKHEKAPDYVIGSLSIRPVDFIEWLSSQEANSKGYVRLSIKEGKKSPYLELDTYDPQKKADTSRQGDNYTDPF